MAVRTPVRSAPPSTAPATDTGTPASTVGHLAEDGLVAKLGAGLVLAARDLAAGGIDLSRAPQPLPGVRLKHASLKDRKVSITGELAIPAVATGDVTLSVAADGTTRISGGAQRRLDLPALGNPTVSVSIAETGELTGTVSDLKVAPSTGPVKPELTANLRIADGRLAGDGSASLVYPNVGAATLNFGFTEAGLFTGHGTVHIAPPFLPPVDAQLSVDGERNLTAHATVDLAGKASPLPGLLVSGGTLDLGWRNGQPSLAVAGLAARYAGLADLRIDQLALDRKGFSGKGAFTLAVPLLQPVNGVVTVGPDGVSGLLTITGKDFPAGLPVTAGSITVKLAEDGAVGFKGTVGVDLGPAGKGDLAAAYDHGRFTLGAEVDLTVPGLQPVHVSVGYADGRISGRADVPVDAERLPGLSGNVTIQYEQDRWSGQTTLGYSADDGKLSGSVAITVAQTERGGLQVGGSGQVTAQIMPSVSGKLEATILPQGGVDVSGTITVSEPVELFPEQRLEKELFSHSQNIPLWAILVAVIRIRAGVRAGVGPGVFRNITVTGSYTIGSTDADPSFRVSGELYIPAFVEGYVAFGAGLGLDVVLGELTGGIEGVGTAGLYGAISVIPELFYENGDWGIEGTATLAAGARLTLALNAWAEIEALWVTVWDEQWQLAEVVMPIGPDLALQAHMKYRFGRPTPPELDFTTSDIDAGSLIQGAMPKDAPPPSGARQALENKAEWKGALREQRTPPAPEPAAPAAAPQPPVKPPGRKPPKDKPRPGEEQAKPAESQDPSKHPTPGNEPARSKAVDDAAATSALPPPVPESQLPPTDKPRYAGPITLATLEEAPAPLPRSPEQEKEDLAAARRATEAAVAHATDSDQLDNYFPRIKTRFGLSALGYQGDFTKGFVVVGEINPSFKLEPQEPLSGTGIPGDLEGRKTKVDFWTTQLSHDKKGRFPVGAKMVAEPLGPDHPLGTEPKGQKDLMVLLPGEYIRGHLLNQHLGGPGEVENLFPITRSANATHEAHMEKWIKRWVNEKRYWVRYSVEVQGEEKLQSAGGELSFINANLLLSASVLSTGLDKLMTVTSTVTSDYKAKAVVSDPLDLKAVEKLEKGLPDDLKREIDDQVQIQVDKDAEAHPVLPEKVEQDLVAMLAEHNGSRAAVERELSPYEQIGPARVNVLFKAFDQLQARPDKSDRRIVGLETGEKRELTRVCNLWLAGLREK